VRCDIGYLIKMPKAMTTDITAQAGAVRLDGLAGDVLVTTQAGAVDGHNLTSAEVTIRTDAGAASLDFATAPTLVQATTNGAWPRPDESCCGAGWVGGFRSSGSPVTGVPVSGI